MLELARLPLEADCFDVVWEGGSGRILTQFSGAAAEEAAARVGDVVDQDWDEVRALQRRPDGVVLKVSGRPTDLPDVIRAAGPDATVVSRAALGLSWIAFAEPASGWRRRARPSPRARARCSTAPGG